MVKVAPYFAGAENSATCENLSVDLTELISRLLTNLRSEFTVVLHILLFRRTFLFLLWNVINSLLNVGCNLYGYTEWNFGLNAKILAFHESRSCIKI